MTDEQIVKSLQEATQDDNCEEDRWLDDGTSDIDILDAFRKYQIEPKRIRFVYPKQNSQEALAILIEGKKQGKKGSLKVLKPLYVYNTQGKYTKEILSIFNYKGK